MAGKIEQRRHLKKTMIHKREQEDEDDEKKVAVPPGKQSSKPDLRSALMRCSMRTCRPLLLKPPLPQVATNRTGPK